MGRAKGQYYLATRRKLQFSMTTILYGSFGTVLIPLLLGKGELFVRLSFYSTVK